MFGSFGWMELLLILIIVLIIFGAGKIPQLGEGLGKAIKGFKRSVHDPDLTDTVATSAGSEEPVDHPPEVLKETSEGGGDQAEFNSSGQPTLEQKTTHPSPKE